MPEQAQRRAPALQAVDSPSRGSDGYEELRRLIVGPEQRGLAELRNRLDDPNRRTEDVSSVVVEAIERRRNQGDEAALAEALGPTIQETIRHSVRNNLHSLADALFPVMGPAIRRSITETLRSMLESFNEALEHSLSWQGIRWRIESFRTGKPFAEIVLMHSLLYRVEQVYLIHRETGLVLNHVVAPAVATQDPTLIAGMLSAIQNFVHDSFESPREDSLGSMTVGELQVWVEQGPHAVIAAVIRGHAPASYRLALKEGLENIEEKFAVPLAAFQGDAGPFRLTTDRLHALLESQFRVKKDESRKPRLAIAAVLLAFLLIASWAVYVTVQAHRWAEFSRSLATHPGIVVTSVDKSGGRWHVHGFRDPLADNPSGEFSRNHVQEGDAALELSPYYSLDAPIVLRRAEKMLAPPPSVKLSLESGKLAATGEASSNWISKFEERAPWIPGVNSLDTSELRNRDVAVLEGVILTFPLGQSTLDPGQEAAIHQAQEKILALRNFAASTNQNVSIALVGRTDSTGVEGNNMVLSRQRADRVAELLARGGVPRSTLDLRGVGPTEPLRSEDTEEGRHLNRSVTFLVHFAPASPVN